MSGDLYFIYDNSIKAFYAKGGSWLPYATAKSQQAQLCVFANVEEARACLNHNGLARKVGIAVLNKKSARSKLRLKNFNPSLKPNWRTMEATFCQEKPVPEKAIHASAALTSTYCSFLNNMEWDGNSKLAIHSAISEELMNTELIRETVQFIELAQSIMKKWEQRLSQADEEIRTCDLRTSDELHRLEFENQMSEKALADCAKRLQEIRRVRRIAKNEKAVGEMMSEIAEKAEVMEKIDHIKNFISNQKERQYYVRVPEAYNVAD